MLVCFYVGEHNYTVVLDWVHICNILFIYYKLRLNNIELDCLSVICKSSQNISADDYSSMCIMLWWMLAIISLILFYLLPLMY